MSPQNKFKAIVAGVFGGFTLLVVASLMVINSKKPKNTEQIVKNNTNLNTNTELTPHTEANAGINIMPNSEPIKQVQQISALPNLNTVNNSANTPAINTLIDKQNPQNNINQTDTINAPAINPTLHDVSNSQNVNNFNKNNEDKNINNANNINNNLNTASVNSNLPSQIVSPESLEIAKLQKRISNLEAKISKQNNMNYSNVKHTHNSSKSNAVKNNTNNNQNKKQAVLAVVGDRTWVKDSTNGNEYNVAKGEKMQSNSQVKYIDNVNDVIIHSSTH